MILLLDKQIVNHNEIHNALHKQITLHNDIQMHLIHEKEMAFLLHFILQAHFLQLLQFGLIVQIINKSTKINKAPCWWW